MVTKYEAMRNFFSFNPDHFQFFKEVLEDDAQQNELEPGEETLAFIQEAQQSPDYLEMLLPEVYSQYRHYVRMLEA